MQFCREPKKKSCEVKLLAKMYSNNLLSRSRELRGGRLIADCNCTRRNGLQYDCPRSDCQGREICLTKPFPKCCPSLFANRFENVSMGKRTNPTGARRVRLLNNGSKLKLNCAFSIKHIHSRFSPS